MATDFDPDVYDAIGDVTDPAKLKQYLAGLTVRIDTAIAALDSVDEDFENRIAALENPEEQ